MEQKQKIILLLSGIASAIALVLSIISLVISNKADVNSVAILIGVLAIIITVLIGWQVFVLIDLKMNQNDYRSLSKEVQSKIYNIKGYASLGYANMNIAWLTPETHEKWFFEYVTHSILALSYFSKIEDYTTCWSIVNDLIHNIRTGDGMFYKGFCDKNNEWIMMLNDVENTSYISNFKDLVVTINKFRQNQNENS